MGAHLGLVVEGPTDHALLEPLLRGALAARGVAPPDLIRLQPAPDATSGGEHEGGWTQVRAWCARHPPELRRALLFEPLFEGVPPRCEVLLVQLDADVLHKVPGLAAAAGCGVAGDPTPAERAEATRGLLRSWLWPGATPHPDEHRTLPLAAVWCAETWLLAGLDPGLAEPEAADPAPRLLALNPGLERPVGSGRLPQSEDKWRQLARRARLEEQAPVLARRCPSLGGTVEALAAALDGDPGVADAPLAGPVP